MKGLNHKLIVDKMHDGLFIAQEGVVKYVNDALAKMIGYTKKEIIGQNFLKFIHEDDQEFLADRYQKRMSGESVPNEYEYRIKHKNGQVIYALGNITVVKIGGKKAVSGTVKDITDRIQSELKIRDIENSYKTLLELVPDPIVVSDFNGNILMHNQAAYDVHEPKSVNFKLIGTNVVEYMATKEEKEKVAKLTFGDTNVLKYDVHLKTQKNRIIPFEMHTTTVYDAQGTPTCKLTIGRDVSRMKDYEEQLKKLIDEKELMIAEIHHRIKNNLQQIYSLLGLQMEGEFISKNYTKNILCDHEFLCFKIIHNVIEDARRRILAISIMHEMFYKQNTDCVEFSMFLKELSESIKHTYDTYDKNIEVNISGDDFELCLDYIIPCGLIANEIIINSYKYAFNNMDSGKIDISLKRENGVREIIISDNGIGISLDDLSKSKTLGLSLIGGLTEQINGTLDIKSDKGKGTTYTIIFKDAKTKSRGIYGTK